MRNSLRLAIDFFICSIEGVIARRHGHEGKSCSDDAVNIEVDLRRTEESASEMTKHIGHDLAYTSELSKAFILEVSVAIHSIVIGFGFGSLGENELTTIKALLIALCFHQLFEGIGVGTAVSDTPLSVASVWWLGLFFSVTVPAGILIGVYTTSTTTGNYAWSITNCIVSGSLLYTALVEMIAQEFNKESIFARPCLKFSMFFSCAIGAGIMAVLALWA